MPPHENTKPQTIHFTLDGRPLTTIHKSLSAEEILRLGGLDASGYDLVEPRKGETPKHYKDKQQVNIKESDQFQSLRESASVA